MSWVEAIFFLVVFLLAAGIVFNLIFNPLPEHSFACAFSPDLSVHGMHLETTFDCNIIYSRLSKYVNHSKIKIGEWEGYEAEGSLANIQRTACSPEVLSIIHGNYGVYISVESCEYWCCVTEHLQAYNAR